MCRVLKIDGQALITVWAKEQKYKEKESFYISHKNSKKNSSGCLDETELIKGEIDFVSENKETNVHKFGKEFQKKDVVCLIYLFFS